MIDYREIVLGDFNEQLLSFIQNNQNSGDGLVRLNSEGIPIIGFGIPF